MQYGPIVAHSVYGNRTGVSPDDLHHYTELGELLTPRWFLDEAHAYYLAEYRAGRLKLEEPHCFMNDDSNSGGALPGAQNRAPGSSVSLLGEPPEATEYNASYTWDELLGGDGWQLHHVDRSDPGTRHWVRPGKNRREGSSATTGHNGIDKLHVFSTEVPWLPCDSRHSRWLVHRDFGGDFRAALRAVRGGSR